MSLFEVRCPCGQLIAKVSAGAVVQAKCRRCGSLFEVQVTAGSAGIMLPV